MAEEYGKRGKVPRKPLVDVGAEKDVPNFARDDYFMSEVMPRGEEYGFGGEGLPLSEKPTPEKERIREWLKRTYSPLSEKGLSSEDIPDISSPRLKYASGYMNVNGPNTAFVSTNDDEGDVDSKDPRIRSTIFHETGHILSGAGDAKEPAMGEYVPFYRGNSSPIKGTTKSSMEANSSMQPFDTTYLALKEKLDKEDADRQRNLGKPNIADRVMSFFRGDKEQKHFAPSSYYNASKMRKQMIDDNEKAILEADDRVNRKNSIRKRLKEQK